MSGRLIVIDGLDGSGKQTQTALLRDFLSSAGYPVKAVSFPDYAQPSSALVKQYLAGEFGQADEVSAYAASSFYAVDRYASYQKFWKAAYLRGTLILADRYATSNYIHQMSKLPPDEWQDYRLWMEDFEYHKLGLPRPDLVIYLDMHPNVSQQLMLARYGGQAQRRDIHEANRQYLQRCRDCALHLADELGWSVISCSDEEQPFTEQQIAKKLQQVVKNTILEGHEKSNDSI